jgi:hypothetical protein
MNRLMRLVPILLLLAAITYADDSVRSVRWACFTAPVSYFDIIAKRTAGKAMVGHCRPHPQFSATVIEVHSDGTGWLLRGYRPGGPAPEGRSDPNRGGYTVTPYIPFNANRVAEIRWRQNGANVHITAENPANGSLEVTRMVVIEELTPNVRRMRSWQDNRGDHQYHARLSWWRVGSPELEALKAWWKCVVNNKGAGFDLKPCTNPLPIEAQQKMASN